MAEKILTSTNNTGENRLHIAGGLANYCNEIFESFANARIPWETIWEECWYNFLGQYSPNTRWMKETEGKGNRSRIFIKLTTLKCHTAHSKIMDAAFPGDGEMPFDTIPVGFRDLGMDPQEAKDMANAFRDRLKDHFRDIEIAETMDSAILELAVLGTAVLKDPVVEKRIISKYVESKIGGMSASGLSDTINPYQRVETEEIVPVTSNIPLWEYYVDSNAKTSADSIMEFHFQRLLPAEFLKLADNGGYDRAKVLEAAQRRTTHDKDDKRYIQLGDNYIGEQGKKDERISTLEGWGWVPAKHLRSVDTKGLTDDIDDDTLVDALVVTAADGIVIKSCVNPLNRRPFRVCPYKKRPHIIYGMGVAEAMRDSQKMINSAARMMIDNKAMSGAGMVAINSNKIDFTKTTDLKIYPYKVWWGKGGASPKEMIDSISFPDITRGLQELIELFERFADEETGLPKYTQGQAGSFLNKTATGMSMLMTQANINLKTVMRNIDRYWVEPIVESHYDWFMEMDADNKNKIPLKIKATGTDSLMAKEIKIEAIMKFMQITNNPSDAIFQDRIKMMKIVADYLDVDEVMKSDEQIAQIMAEMQERSKAFTDLRKDLDIDKLYLILQRSEQVQVLKELGIVPAEVVTQATPPGSPQGQDLTNLAPEGLPPEGAPPGGIVQ